MVGAAVGLGVLVEVDVLVVVVVEVEVAERKRTGMDVGVGVSGGPSVLGSPSLPLLSGQRLHTKRSGWLQKASFQKCASLVVPCVMQNSRC